MENVEVTSKVDTSVVRIVGGYVNGGLQEIGVKNAKISLGTTSVNIRSDSSLIGQVGPNVKWIDSQAASIGNLQIDPNKTNSTFVNIAKNTTAKVPGSFLDTAFYIGGLSVLGIRGGVGTLYKYNDVVEVNPSIALQDGIIATTNKVTTVTSKSQKLVADALFDSYNSNPTKTVYFDRYQPPVVSSTTNKFIGNSISTDNPDVLNLALSNREIEVPANSIWFKPLNAGTSALVFLRQSQANRNEAISVFHFIRGEINTISNFGETRFEIAKIGNKSGVYFDFKIPQSMITSGFEFLISATPDLTVAAETSGFLYLYLAGTDQTTGVQSADVRAVDFVYKNGDNSFQNVSIQNYVPKRTLLKIVGTYNGAVVYNMRDVGKNPVYNGKVYFAIPSGNVVVQNPITSVDNGVGELIA